MKTLIGLIPPSTLPQVRTALLDMGVVGLTVTHVKSTGQEHPHPAAFIPQIKLEILLGDVGTDRVIDTLTDIVRQNPEGDGKIYVLETACVVRVRTGETGEAAI